MHMQSLHSHAFALGAVYFFHQMNDEYDSVIFC